VSNIFRKLFGKKETESIAEIDTIPVESESNPPESMDTLVETTKTAPLSPDNLSEIGQRVNPAQLIVGCGHSVGRQRDHNEDALFTMTSSLVADSNQVPFGLYIVADGMGGHQHGELASGLAVRAISGHILRKLYLPFFGLLPQMPDESLQEIMQEAVMEGHRAIVKESVNSGTTATVAVILGDQLMISHVGDSRAYAIYPGGSYKILTRDHSLVKRLEELGQITNEEAALHPQRNVLYRALGQNEPFEPDINSHPLPRGGYLLLCSDGMWGTVTNEEITATVRDHPKPEIACQKLVDAANAAGGPDNISVIIIHIPD
jgi:PPM family protein phosphatase